jgi:hypothetical protein
MMLQHLLEVSPITLFLLLPVVFLIYHLVQYILDPLRSIPGPFLARFTRLCRSRGEIPFLF